MYRAQAEVALLAELITLRASLIEAEKVKDKVVAKPETKQDVSY